MARLIGADTPGAARYELESRNFIAKILKAIQGSRPSDFDMRFYIGLLPTLTEIQFDENGNLSPAVLERFQIMEDQLEIATNAAVDPIMARRARQQRSLPKTSADLAMERSVEQFVNREIGLDEFNANVSEWKAQRADPGLATPESRARSAVDSFFGGREMAQPPAAQAPPPEAGTFGGSEGGWLTEEGFEGAQMLEQEGGFPAFQRAPESIPSRAREIEEEERRRRYEEAGELPPEMGRAR
jgi:hypothetical protein